MQYEFVSFEDCRNVVSGGEDEIIARIDAEREEERAYESDVNTGSDSLIGAVHAARRFFR